MHRAGLRVPPEPGKHRLLHGEHDDPGGHLRGELHGPPLQPEHIGEQALQGRPVRCCGLLHGDHLGRLQGPERLVEAGAAAGGDAGQAAPLGSSHVSRLLCLGGSAEVGIPRPDAFMEEEAEEGCCSTEEGIITYHRREEIQLWPSMSAGDRTQEQADLI